MSWIRFASFLPSACETLRMSCFLGMAIPPSPAHVTTPCSATSSRSLFPTTRRVSCVSFPQYKRESRRSVSFALLLLHWCCSNPKHAFAGSIFDKYVKRKKLDPLEAYVPPVLLTQMQFHDLEKTLEDDKPQFDVGRALLRSGPAASLRVNIRAVAQYASDDGRGKAAFDAVDRCLTALEDLDSLLLRALRNDQTVTVESMKAKINIALGALDSLLETVPSPVLDKGKAIADAYSMPSNMEESNSEDLDPDLKQLEAVL